MKNTFLILYLILIFGIDSLLAQKEYNNWYFGFRAGINFNSGIGILNNDMPNSTSFNALEGCATYSDPQSGNLLLYTDGQSVFNVNHDIMPNGLNLLGHESSSQAALIVPLPNSSTIFYIFTTDFRANSNGLRYTVVDLSLDGGLGEVTNDKNILLKTPVTECLSATKHQNGIDYWIVAHDWGNDDFLAYLLASSGLDTNPVISNTGNIRGGDDINAVGYLKFSPDGKKVVTTFFGEGKTELFQFNNSNGIVSEMIQFPFLEQVWGCSFSPDNSKLYLATAKDSPNQLLQYEVCNYDANEIINSEVLISSSAPTNTGGLQIAPDGKIYVTVENSYDIGVINSPNNSGSNCDYVELGFSLANRQSRWCPPNLIDDVFQASDALIAGFEITDTCLGKLTEFISLVDASTYMWNFDDPQSGNDNYSILQNPSHIFSQAGTYHVKLIISENCFIDSTIINVSIDAPQITSIETTNPSCENDNGSLEIIAETGTGQLEYSIDGVNFLSNNTFNNLPSGNYTITVQDENGCTSAQTTEIHQSSTLSIDFNILSSAICNKNDGAFEIIGSGGTPPYEYSIDGNTFQQSGFFSNLSPNTYNAVIQDSVGCTIERIIEISGEQSLLITNIEIIPTTCGDENGSIAFEVSGATGQISISLNGSTPQNVSSIQGLGTGEYEVEILDGAGCEIDTTITVFQSQSPLYIPNAFSPNDDGFNDSFQIYTGARCDARVKLYLIFNRWGGQIYEAKDFLVNSSNHWWDGTFKGKKMDSGVYVYYIEFEFENGEKETIGGDISIIK